MNFLILKIFRIAFYVERSRFFLIMFKATLKSFVFGYLMDLAQARSQLQKHSYKVVLRKTSVNFFFKILWKTSITVTVFSIVAIELVPTTVAKVVTSIPWKTYEQLLLQPHCWRWWFCIKYFLKTHKNSVSHCSITPEKM